MFRLFLLYIRLIVFWLLFYWAARLLFLLYNYPFSLQFNLSDLLLTFYYGSVLDVSAIGYLTGIPTLLFCISPWMSSRWFRYLINGWTVLLLILQVIIILADMELYRHWGFRLDKTPLLYLKTPSEAFASTTWTMNLLFLFLTSLTGYLAWRLYAFLTRDFFSFSFDRKWRVPILYSLLLLLLILPIRGGTGVASMNVSAVYFHKELFPNHAAINVAWNVAASLAMKEEGRDYHFMDDEEAEERFQQTLISRNPVTGIIHSDRPNIVLIILESFSGRVVEGLGGAPDVTPNLNQFAQKGILFDHFYASGDRSDKGIISILSGFPAQPTTSIIKYPARSARLPYLSHELSRAGYHTSFYYGGDLNFANMKSYFVHGRFDRIVTLEDFGRNLAVDKWGVHDGVVFERLANDLAAEQEPFFAAFFTLSSHEPFTVPMEPRFAGESEDDRFRNSVWYTDSCLGQFIRQCSTKEFYSNTLFVLLADHGSRHPGNVPYYLPEKFHIPLVFYGDVLMVTDTVISHYGNQTDLAVTLLSMLGLPSGQFLFGNSLFESGLHSSSFYVFNDGFGFMLGESTIVYENKGGKILHSSGPSDDEILKTGMALLQVTMREFNRKENEQIH
jgi:phosphoglycerol transferase MdoB-like AlkP superfamily enzyme